MLLYYQNIIDYQETIIKQINFAVENHDYSDTEIIKDKLEMLKTLSNTLQEKGYITAQT